MSHGTSTQTASATIVDALEKEIIFGALLPKQRLYEDEIIFRFDAKRHVVRTALQELERKGIVERVPNRGAMVRFYSREEVEELYVLRRILHEAAARRIRLPPDPAWLDALHRAQEEHSRAVEALDLSAIFTANNRFHQTLFAGTGNAYLVEAIDFSNAKTHGIRSHGLSAARLQRQAEEEHLQMIEAVEQGDLERLAACCVAHMEPARAFYEEKYCPDL